MNGLKYDDGKPRLDLVPPEAVMALGRVLTYGAEKYAPNSWRGVNEPYVKPDDYCSFGEEKDNEMDD